MSRILVLRQVWLESCSLLTWDLRHAPCLSSFGLSLVAPGDVRVRLDSVYGSHPPLSACCPQGSPRGRQPTPASISPAAKLRYQLTMSDST